MKKILAVALLYGSPLYGDDTFVDFRAPKPAVTLTIAQAALEHCREAGFQIGAIVASKFSVAQVFLRDQYTGVHVLETTHRKAWTASTFRTPTGELSKHTVVGTEGAGLRNLSKAMMVGGGLAVFYGEGSLVAGISISVAPGGNQGENCAAAGIAVIEHHIVFKV